MPGLSGDCAGWVYTGEVYHRRKRPRIHTLRYRVFSLLLDVDRIDQLCGRTRWFSRNRFNIVSFYDKDFGTDPRCDTPSMPTDLRRWVSCQLSQAGLHAEPDSILLSCYPRVLGYAFNPLSLYYCRNASGATYAVVHEVHNTFGERHAYVLGAELPALGHAQVGSAAAGAAGDVWIKQNARKALFVSPFADMNLHYRFRLNEPAVRQIVVIRAEDSEGVLITASYVAKGAELTTSTLLKCVVRMPLMTWKVIAGIHYEALKLWLKRVPWFSHIPKPQVPVDREDGSEPTHSA